MGVISTKKVALFFAFLATVLFAQTLYISPAMDLALSVYEPFYTVEPMRPGEIGLFRVAGASSTIQIVSFEIAPTVTLEQVFLATRQDFMKERSFGAMRIANLNCLFRWFSIETDIVVQSFQLIFLRAGKAYVLSYFAPEEEFHKYLIPALLTVCSLKGPVWFNYVSEKYGYRMNVHQPFEPAQSEEGEIGSFVALQDKKAGYIQIVQEKLPRRMKVAEYAEFVEKNTLEKLNGYRSLSSGQNLVEGNEFFWRIFTFAQSGTVLKALQTHTVFDDVAITLTYLATEQSFEQFLPAAVATMFSFKM